MSRLFLQILNMSVSATWLILAAVLARLVLRKAPKYLRFIIWTFVAFRLICPFSIESVFSLIPVTDTAEHEIVPITVKEELEERRSYNYEHDLVYIDTGERDKELLELSSYESIGEDKIELSPYKVDTMDVLSMIWIIGVLGLFIYSFISYSNLKKRISTAAYVWDRIWISDEVETPFLLGFRNPRIYLPSAMSDEIGNQVVAHEYAHLKRKDHFWKFIGFFIACIHWVNPFVWLAYVLLSRDMEYACDEKVIKSFSLEDKKKYTKALVSCSIPHKMLITCPIAFAEMNTKKRVKAVLDYKKPKVGIVIISVILFLVIVMLFITNPITHDDMIYAEGNHGEVLVNEILRSYREKLLVSSDKEKAFSLAVDECYREEALYQEAMSYYPKRIGWTDEDVDKYLKEYLVEIKTNGEWYEYLNILSKYGSEKEFIEKNIDYYKKVLTNNEYKEFLIEQRPYKEYLSEQGQYIDDIGNVSDEEYLRIWMDRLVEEMEFEVVSEQKRIFGMAEDAWSNENVATDIEETYCAYYGYSTCYWAPYDITLKEDGYDIHKKLYTSGTITPLSAGVYEISESESAITKSELDVLLNELDLDVHLETFKSNILFSRTGNNDDDIDTNKIKLCVGNTQTGECPLVITEDGDVYVNGYFYSGKVSGEFLELLDNIVLNRFSEEERYQIKRQLFSIYTDVKENIASIKYDGNELAIANMKTGERYLMNESETDFIVDEIALLWVSLDYDREIANYDFDYFIYLDRCILEYDVETGAVNDLTNGFNWILSEDGKENVGIFLNERVAIK